MLFFFYIILSNKNPINDGLTVLKMKVNLPGHFFTALPIYTFKLGCDDTLQSINLYLKYELYHSSDFIYNN